MKGAEPQTVFPSEKPRNSKRGFVRIDNSVLQNNRLSLRARGLMGFVLSKPKNFRHSAERLAKPFMEGTDVIERAINELRDAGHCQRLKNRDCKGRFQSVLHFYETPQPTAENRVSAPTADLPAAGEPTGRSTDSRLSVGLLNDSHTNDSLKNESKGNESVGINRPDTPNQSPLAFNISDPEQQQIIVEFRLTVQTCAEAVRIYRQDKLPYVHKDGPLSFDGLCGWLRTSRTGKAFLSRHTKKHEIDYTKPF